LILSDDRKRDLGATGSMYRTIVELGREEKMGLVTCRMGCLGSEQIASNTSTNFK
jgi:hypothetical protein